MDKAQLHLFYEENVDPYPQLAHVSRDLGVPLVVALLDLLRVQIREDVVEEELPFVRQGRLGLLAAEVFRKHPSGVQVARQQIVPYII